MNQGDKLETLRVLVTGAGGPAGIVALRLLAKEEGIVAYGVDIDDLASGQVFATEFRTMAPVREREAYCASLRRCISEWNINVVIPTVHEELPYIHKVLAGTNVRYVLSPQETLLLGDNKERFFEWANSEVPEFVAEWQRADAPCTLVAEKLFIKPIQGRGGRGCKPITRDELEYLRTHHPEIAEASIVSELLPGTEWTVDVYMRVDGTPAYIVPRERLGLAGGISIKGRTVKNLEVIRRTEMLLKKIPVRGPVCVQWKADKNGIPKLVEMNPRLAGGTLITVASGANPIACLVDEARGKTTPIVDWQEVTVVGWLDYKTI